jgi:hypothetical protein
MSNHSYPLLSGDSILFIYIYSFLFTIALEGVLRQLIIYLLLLTIFFIFYFIDVTVC